VRSFLRWPFWTMLVVLEVFFNRLLVINYPSFSALALPHYSSKKLGKLPLVHSD
jgi:hypothetical protein